MIITKFPENEGFAFKLLKWMQFNSKNENKIYFDDFLKSSLKN